MIRIYPFQAFLPRTEEAKQIAPEPYDVIDTEEARERAAGNPLSFLHVVRSEIDLPEGTNPYEDAVYQKAAENLQWLIEGGHLTQQSEPGIYVYRLIFEGRTQIGVVACCEAAQYRSDEIRKHEKTRPDKEDDRTKHMTTCSAHAEPVFLTFRDQPPIEKLLRGDVTLDPLIDFTAEDGVRHTVWQAQNGQAYIDAFAELDALYIADGHHRTAGAERAASQRQKENPQHTGNEEYNRILAVIFPASHLRILAYNRVVQDLNGLSEQEFVDQLGTVADVKPTDDPIPDHPGTVCTRIKSGWYRIRFEADTIDHSDPIESLDVSLLQTRVLEPILGVGDPRTDARLGFVGGIRGTCELEERVDSGEAAVAFSMYPTRIGQLLDVSDAGAIMPPKSTWFEPKLRSGLFVHTFEHFDTFDHSDA